MKNKMRTRNLWVSLFAIVSVLVLLLSNVQALPITSGITTEVNGVDADYASVVAGQTVPIVVSFTAEESDTHVTIKAEIKGDKIDVETETSPFDIEENKTYRKVLSLKIPYELEDELSQDLTLNIEIDGEKYFSDEEYTLRVQRPSYNVGFMSVSFNPVVDAGELFPVSIVLKNIGYNDLDDLYVNVEIPALGVKKTAYFGDIVANEWNYSDDDDTDTVSGTFYLEVPYEVQPGTYNLEVTATNDDLTLTRVEQIVVENEFYNNVIVTDFRKTVMVGEEAEYELLIVNPTNKLKVYRIVTESTSDVASSVTESVVAVPAGLSKSVKVIAKANSEGEHEFDVSVFSGEELLSTITFNVNAQANTLANPVVVLTIVLAIVFLVLLGVLVVLITKKPKKTEEYEESYY